MPIPDLPVDGTKPWGDALRTWADAIEAAMAVRRHTLTGDWVVATAGWPTDTPVTLVLTQDGTGGHTVTHDAEALEVDATPAGETVTAWVWTGTRWWGRSSAGTAVPATPPVWAEGTTATTGDPDATQVVVTFSQPIPSGSLQYRMGAADIWRNITKTSPTTLTLTGLTALTTYAAPQFKVLNSAGETAILTAQGFTTDATPPSWVTIQQDNFTDTDGTLITAHTPDVGGAWTAPNGPGVTIYGNRVRPSRTADFTGGSRGHTVKTAVALASKKIRLTMEYTSGGVSQTVGFGITLNNAAQYFFSTGWYVGSEAGTNVLNVTATETSGLTLLAPGSGTAVFELDAAGTSGTLHINGVLHRSWTFDWQGRNFTHIQFDAGGNDLYDGLSIGTLSASWLESVKLEHWQ